MILQVKSLICLIIFLAFLINPVASQAQKIYQTTWAEAGIIFGTSAAMFGGSQLIQNHRGPITAADIAILDSETILSIDKNTILHYSNQARIISDHFRNGILLAPLTLFLSKQGRENTNEILIMYTEVVSLNIGITYFVKEAVGRYRPYAYNPAVALDLKLANTTRQSFFSGHVSHVASLSFFTATVFDDLYPESNYKYLVWAGAITAPAITGYLRYKAGRHFPTDVIVGYGVGALVGYFIPALHTITKEKNIEIIGAEGGLGLKLTF